jgi:hypothetical protein
MKTRSRKRISRKTRKHRGGVSTLGKLATLALLGTAATGHNSSPKISPEVSSVLTQYKGPISRHSQALTTVNSLRTNVSMPHTTVGPYANTTSFGSHAVTSVIPNTHKAVSTAFNPNNIDLSLNQYASFANAENRIRRAEATHAHTKQAIKHVTDVIESIDNSDVETAAREMGIQMIQTPQLVDDIIQTGEQFPVIMSERKLNQLYIITPHNSPTVESRGLGIGKRKLTFTTPNQQLTIQEYLNDLPAAGILGLDIDVGRRLKFGPLVSKHGGIISRVFNASHGNTKEILHDVFTVAEANPSSIILIRMENNNDVGAKDILNILSPEHRNRIYGIKHGEMPTHGEVVKSGKNVLIMLEKPGGDLDPVTKNYEGGIMPQDHFVYRTKWNEPKGITKGGIIPDKYMVTTAIDNLPKNGAYFNMIDGYFSLTGANRTKLPEQMEMVPEFIQTTIPSLQQTIASKGMNENNVTGGIIMLDAVNPALVAYMLHCNIATALNEPMPDGKEYIATAEEFIENFPMEGIIDWSMHHPAEAVLLSSVALYTLRRKISKLHTKIFSFDDLNLNYAKLTSTSSPAYNWTKYQHIPTTTWSAYPNGTSSVANPITHTWTGNPNGTSFAANADTTWTVYPNRTYSTA